MNGSLDALRSLAESITVRDLIDRQELLLVQPGERSRTVWQELDRLDFDVAPLADEPVYRYVERDTLARRRGPVEGAARVILTGDLVGGGSTLGELISRFRSHPRFFVLDRGGITGIVTRADLRRPQVSLVAFGWMTALEAALRVLVARHTNGSWMDHLTAAARARLGEQLTAMRATDTELDPVDAIDATYLTDLLAIASKTPQLRKR